MDDRQPHVLPVGQRSDRRHLREQAERRGVDLALVKDIEVILVERRQSRDGCCNHRHWMRIVGESTEEAAQILVDDRVSAQTRIEGIVLFLRGQLTVDEEVADFNEVRLLGKLFDRVPAVLQHTFVTVDEGDGRRGGCGVGKPWIVGDRTGLLEQRADAVSVVARRR
jgi:hypothetical protein